MKLGKKRCPEVYVSDFSGKIIKSSRFIMQMMDGDPLWKCDFTPEEAARVQAEKIGMLTKIHTIKNDRYGYRQSGLHPSWSEALKAMTVNLISDCKNLGYETEDGEKFLKLIEKHEDVLRQAPCQIRKMK